MKPTAVFGLMIVSWLGISSPADAQSKPSSVQTAGDCSITISGNGNSSTLVCADLDPKLANQIKAILSGTERTQTALRELSEKLDQIAHKVSDRRLTPQQVHALQASARSVCTSFPAINVTASNGNQEAQRFAMDFVDAFKAVGCKADLALPIPGLRPDIAGVFVGVRDINSVDPRALALSKMLSDAGVRCSLAPVEADFFPGEHFVLVVGAKE